MPQKNSTCIKLEIWIEGANVEVHTIDLLKAVQETFGDRAKIQKCKSDVLVNFPILGSRNETSNNSRDI